ncbi:hypothetical protein DFH08DRAFT_886633 [Mycena albidolilacea]|uniref:Uncharacterized protein n=1 Tax=Mycena albidolilacea TaxID=1033008 RepID=A0AAD6ZJE0_9AGAR|nr:hypothetical protein DFH08DRAFT_886633 [Mycena albidolilacea]
MYWSVRTLLTTAVGCRTTFCSRGSCLLHQGSWECVAGVSWLTTSTSTSTSYTINNEKPIPGSIFATPSAVSQLHWKLDNIASRLN